MTVRIFKYFLLCILFFSIYDADAQYDDVGFMIGGSTYKGELSRNMMNDKFIHPAFGFFYRHNWNRRWAWKLSVNFGKVSGDDAKAKTQFELDRNLSFYSSIFEVSPQIEFNFLPFETGRVDYPFTPYLFTGISLFSFNPKATLGNQEFELQPLGTEGQGTEGIKRYKRLQLAIPIGGGIKVSLGRFGFGLEMGARRTYTDYLDDVSTVYPNMAALQATNGAVAVLLSDRSFSRLDTTTSIPSFYQKQRGNSSDNDWYLFAGATFFFRLSSPLRDICKPFKQRRY
jgi:hypothetical protein